MTGPNPNDSPLSLVRYAVGIVIGVVVVLALIAIIILLVNVEGVTQLELSQVAHALYFFGILFIILGLVGLVVLGIYAFMIMIGALEKPGDQPGLFGLPIDIPALVTALTAAPKWLALII